jgi:DnaJ-class molecular chaperone
MKDTILYDNLGLSPYLSDEELKKEGKKLLLKWHPDKNENKEESSKRFIEIKEILEILTDPEKRKLYHQIGISIKDIKDNKDNNQNMSSHSFNHFNNEFFKDFNTNFFNLHNSFQQFPGFQPFSANFPSFPSFKPYSPFKPDYMNTKIDDITHVINIDKDLLKEEEIFKINYKNKEYCKVCNETGFIQQQYTQENSNIFFMSICNQCSGRKFIENDKNIVITINREKLLEIIDNKNTIILKNNGNIFKNKITDLIIIFECIKKE